MKKLFDFLEPESVKIHKIDICSYLDVCEICTLMHANDLYECARKYHVWIPEESWVTINWNENLHLLHYFIRLPVETSSDSYLIVNYGPYLINLCICWLIRIEVDLGYLPTPLHHSVPMRRGHSPQAVYVRS